MSKLSRYIRPSLVTLAAVFIGVSNASAKEVQLLSWSEDPASFEQHLRRRSGSPFFPPDRQKVSPEELATARTRDQQEVGEVGATFQALLERILRLPNSAPFSEINALREEVDDLLWRAISVGGPAKDFAIKLQDLRSLVIEGMKAAANSDPDAREAFARAEQFYLQGFQIFAEPLVLQLTRKNGPVPAADVVPRILSESPTTIAIVVAAVPPELRRLLLQQAEVIANEARERGVSATEIKMKLDALRGASR
jgi:hypothetical protein